MATIIPKEKQMTLAEKKALLDKAADKINDKAKKVICGRIGRTPEIQDKLNIDWIPTPSYKVNQLTGGGFPKGKFTLISGNEDSGKTFLCLETIGYNMAQNPDFIAVWLESENSINIEEVVAMFDIDLERFFFIQHEKDGGAESAMEILGAVADTGIASMVVVNSLKALVPKTELDNSLEKDTVAMQARFNSKMIKKFTAMTQEHDTAFIMITHLTTIIGGNTMNKNPFMISGGKAIRYASVLTLEMNKLSIQESDPINREEGLKIKVTCKKNHCICTRYPYGAVEYFVKFGKGIAWELELMQAALDMGVLVSKGAWMYEIDQVTGETAITEDGAVLKWNGKAAFREFVLNNKWYHERLENKVSGTYEIEALSDEEISEIQSNEIEPSRSLSDYDPNAESDPIKSSRKKK